MNKTAIIIIIVFLALALVGLLVYGFIAMPMQQAGGGTTTGNTGNQPPNSNNAVPDADMDRLATSFRNVFENSWSDHDRCNQISQANSLTDTELKRWSDIYKQKFGVTPYQQMNNANFWCGAYAYIGFGGDQGKKLFDRLGKL